MATKQTSGHQGQVKDPAHDGRLKGHQGGEAKAAHEPSRGKAQEEQGQQAKGESHGGKQQGKAQHEEPANANQGGGDDLKAREYKDADGNVHHHTKAYMEQHRGE